jgi:hypothetical protein
MEKEGGGSLLICMLDICVDYRITQGRRVHICMLTHTVAESALLLFGVLNIENGR